MPAWPATIAAFLVAIGFFTVIGLPLARASAPRGMPALAMAPALGWAAFVTLALPLLTVIGFGAVQVSLCAAAAAALAVAMWQRARAPMACMPRWTLPLAGALAFLPMMAIMPKTVPDGILLGPPVFDHVKIAVVDAILRSGLPVPNPFYGPGGPGHLAYYYLWHFGAALLGSLLHSGGWAAEAAMTGFTAFTALLLAMGAAVALGAPRLGAAAVGVLVLPGAMRPVLHAVIGEGLADHLIPRSADLGGWLNQAAWVPQHLASACCLILGGLVMLRLATEGELLAAGVLGVVAAAGFQSSVWVGGIAFAASACVLGGVLLRQVPGAAARWMFLLHGMAAASLAAALIWPSVLADLQAVRARHAGVGLAFEPYAVFGTRVPAGWRTALDWPAFWVVLLPFEFPAILPLAVAGLLSCRHQRAWPADRRRLVQLFWTLSAACLGVAWLLRSTIDNNDLGWRAVLPAILLGAALAAAELARLAQARRWLPLGAALAVAALGVPDGVRMLGEYARGQLPGDARAYAGSQALWQAVRRHAGKLDRVANSPLAAARATPWPVNIAWATLSDRPSCFSGWETMIAYGPLARERLIAASDLFARVFAGRAQDSDVATLARAFDCAVVAVSPDDGAWTADPFAASADYRLAEGTQTWRIYVRPK